MDWYHLVLFVHILGVLGLFMAFAVEVAIMVGVRNAHTVETVRAWSSASKLLDVVLPITSLLILGAGLAMTIGFWGWSHAWIDLSLGLLVLLSIIGAAFNGTHARRIAQRATALGQGPIPPDFRRELNHPLHWTSVISMATLGLGIVFLMVERPDWLWSIITLVMALLVGVILAQMLVRSGQARVSSQEAGYTEEQAPGLSTRT